jgi:colanic acid/amylovoran biosynthesis glycosyltransferase
MRVAFVLNGFPLVSETFVLSQIVGLLRRGHEVDIYADRPPELSAVVHPELIQYRLLERTRYRDALPAARLARRWSAVKILVRWGWRIPLRTLDCLNAFVHGRRALCLQLLFDGMPRDRISNNYDIVHCHFGPNGQRAVAARRAGAFRAPVITTFHGYDANSLPRYFGSGYYRYLFKHGDLFTVGSQFMHRRIVSYGAPDDRIVKLPMGVDTRFFRFATRRLPADGPITLLTVARLVEVKGVEYALRALPLILQSYPRLKYIVAGDGPLRAELQALAAQLGISQRVAFMGAVTRDRVVALHREAQVFILPSVVTAAGEEENQPVSLAEAQASGLPVVATAIGGVGESIRDRISGLLVPSRDSRALASAVRWLIEHHEGWEHMGLAGRAHVMDRFDMEKLHDRLVSIYEHVAAERNSGARNCALKVVANPEPGS